MIKTTDLQPIPGTDKFRPGALATSHCLTREEYLAYHDEQGTLMTRCGELTESLVDNLAGGELYTYHFKDTPTARFLGFRVLYIS